MINSQNNINLKMLIYKDNYKKKDNKYYNSNKDIIMKIKFLFEEFFLLFYVFLYFISLIIY